VTRQATDRTGADLAGKTASARIGDTDEYGRPIGWQLTTPHSCGSAKHVTDTAGFNTVTWCLDCGARDYEPFPRPDDDER
jgi:hypothetical protein